jgi:uncharacterized protein (DUF1501 family)
MDIITRRRFLTASGVVAGGALATAATAYGFGDILATAGRRQPGAGTLVLVTLYGGNDGLNPVVPYAAPPTPRPGRRWRTARIRSCAWTTRSASIRR